MKKIRDDIYVSLDFDGTITKIDVGNRLFNKFSDGKSEEPVSLWRAGKISSKECFEKECALVKADKEDLIQYALEQEVHPDFIGFHQFLKSLGVGHVILSDGIDFYIKAILDKYGLNIPFYSNRVSFENGTLKPEFPYYEFTCGNCANCKGYHIRRLKNEYSEVIFIGDGLSDRCAVREADAVFAKADLLNFCHANEIECQSYRNFEDIRSYISKLVDGAKQFF